MKVYEYPGFPNPERIRIALAEKHATGDVEFITVDVPKGEHRSPAFLAKNPCGAVPVLELDDGTMISECTAITEYLDARYDRGPSLCGKPGKQRAIIHMMQRRAERGLLDALVAYFHHATPGLGPDLETDPVPAWGRREAQHALATMRQFNALLATQSFLAGEEFSMADITAFAGLAFADFVAIKIPDECMALRAWRVRIAGRPSMAKAA
jgi:glutathione S-transferase